MSDVVTHEQDGASATTSGGSFVDRARRLGWWAARWPSVLAVTLALVGGGGGASGLATALAVLPLAYVVPTALGRRNATWPVVLIALVGFVILRLSDVLDPLTVMLVVAVVGLAVGWRRHDSSGRRREVTVQALGLVVFGGLAVIGAVTAPDVAVWVVAAGWFGHGVWDFVHLYRDAVVARTFAEWCGVLDVLTAAQLVLVALAGP